LAAIKYTVTVIITLINGVTLTPKRLINRRHPIIPERPKASSGTHPARRVKPPY
jgi:hypothetical protein